MPRGGAGPARRGRSRPPAEPQPQKTDEEKRHEKLRALGENPDNYDVAAQIQMLELLGQGQEDPTEEEAELSDGSSRSNRSRALGRPASAASNASTPRKRPDISTDSSQPIDVLFLADKNEPKLHIIQPDVIDDEDDNDEESETPSLIIETESSEGSRMRKQQATIKQNATKTTNVRQLTRQRREAQIDEEKKGKAEVKTNGRGRGRGRGAVRRGGGANRGRKMAKEVPQSAPPETKEEKKEEEEGTQATLFSSDSDVEFVGVTPSTPSDSIITTPTITTTPKQDLSSQFKTINQTPKGATPNPKAVVSTPKGAATPNCNTARSTHQGATPESVTSKTPKSVVTQNTKLVTHTVKTSSTCVTNASGTIMQNSQSAISSAQKKTNEEILAELKTVGGNNLKDMVENALSQPKNVKMSAKLKLRLLRPSLGDLDSTQEEEPVKLDVQNVSRKQNGRQGRPATVVADSPEPSSSSTTKDGGSQGKAVLVEESSEEDEETQDVTAQKPSDDLCSQQDMFSASPSSPPSSARATQGSGPYLHSTPKQIINETVLDGSGTEETMQQEESEAVQPSSVYLQETLPLTPKSPGNKSEEEKMEEEEETQDATLSSTSKEVEKKNENSDVELEEEEEKKQGQSRALKRKHASQHDSGPPCKKFELEWPSSQKETPPPSPNTTPIKLVNKVRLRRKNLLDRNPYHVRPANMSIEMYAKKLRSLWDNYAAELREAQKQSENRFPMSGPIVVGTVIPGTLEYKPIGEGKRVIGYVVEDPEKAAEIRKKHEERMQRRDALGLRTRLPPNIANAEDDFLPDIGTFARRPLRPKTGGANDATTTNNVNGETSEKSKTPNLSARKFYGKPSLSSREAFDLSSEADDFPSIIPSTKPLAKTTPQRWHVTTTAEPDANSISNKIVLKCKKGGGPIKNSVLKSRRKLAAKDQEVFTGDEPASTEFDDFFHEANKLKSTGKADSTAKKSTGISESTKVTSTAAGATGSKHRANLLAKLKEHEEQKRGGAKTLPPKLFQNFSDASDEDFEIAGKETKDADSQGQKRQSKEEEEVTPVKARKRILTLFDDKEEERWQAAHAVIKKQMSEEQEEDEISGECPMCYTTFPMARLAVHATVCEGVRGRGDGALKNIRTVPVYAPKSLRPPTPPSQIEIEGQTLKEPADVYDIDSGEEWQPDKQDKALQISINEDEAMETEEKEEGGPKRKVAGRGRGARGRGRPPKAAGRGGKNIILLSPIDKYYEQQEIRLSLEAHLKPPVGPIALRPITPRPAAPSTSKPAPATPTPKVPTKECIICNQSVPMATYEQHVMDCLDRQEIKNEQAKIEQEEEDEQPARKTRGRAAQPMEAATAGGSRPQTVPPQTNRQVAATDKARQRDVEEIFLTDDEEVVPAQPGGFFSSITSGVKKLLTSPKNKQK